MNTVLRARSKIPRRLTFFQLSQSIKFKPYIEPSRLKYPVAPSHEAISESHIKNSKKTPSIMISQHDTRE